MTPTARRKAHTVAIRWRATDQHLGRNPITLSYALHNSTLYYALNWIPKIVVDLSFTQSQAASVAAWCSGGGILGSVWAAWLATRIQIRTLTVGALFATAIFLCLFAYTPASLAYLTGASMLLSEG